MQNSGKSALGLDANVAAGLALPTDMRSQPHHEHHHYCHGQNEQVGAVSRVPIAFVIRSVDGNWNSAYDNDGRLEFL